MSIVTDERKDPKGRKLRIGESYDEKSGHDTGILTQIL